MSLLRWIYYSTALGGWAAFCGWLVAEILRAGIKREAHVLQVAVTAGVTGAAIGLGLCLAAAMQSGQWRQLARRALPSLAGGGLGGIVGGLAANALYFDGHGLPRAFGWMIMGLVIGVVEGLYEKSPRKIRNGLIGGGLGGLLGGAMFDPIALWTRTDSGMASRATSLVVLGLCIGGAVSLVQVVLKQAWLTVVDGYRTGRQLNLTEPLTVLGRSDRLAMPLLGPQSRDVEAEHVRVTRQSDGSYALEDNHTRIGTRLNTQPVTGQMPLRDGDVIRIGGNLVRFNERRRRAIRPPAPERWSDEVRPPAATPPVPLPPAAVVLPAPPPAPLPPPPPRFPSGAIPPAARPATYPAIRPPPPPAVPPSSPPPEQARPR